MAFWYLARPDELLLDFDQYDKYVNRYKIWGEMFRQRLRDAIKDGKLRVRETKPGRSDVVLARSNTHDHFHVFIRLAEPMKLEERMVWQMRLASDWKRAQADLMRMARGIDPASLLIRSSKVPGLWREPDETCDCTTKHDTLVMSALMKQGKGCEVWNRLRGATPWELFGAPAHNGIEEFVNLPVGYVPLDLIMRVGTLKGGADVVA